MNLAFIVNNLGVSEQNYQIINLVEKINKTTNHVIPHIFFENLAPPLVNPNCLTMNISGLSNFNGKVVCFDINSSQSVYNNNSNTENWLYLWDLPWLGNLLHYTACLNLLSKFKIVARSESHKQNIENFTGRSDIYLAKDMDELYKCLT
jgi:hypothetical protein